MTAIVEEREFPGVVRRQNERCCPGDSERTENPARQDSFLAKRYSWKRITKSGKMAGRRVWSRNYTIK